MPLNLLWKTARSTLVRMPVQSVWARYTVPLLPRRNAGHSHWQNVRHTKEANDKERARVTTIVLAQIDFAVKCMSYEPFPLIYLAGGGIKDPKINGKLAAAIADAKSKNIPLDTINRRLSAQDITEPYVIEVQAPGGVFALIETRAKSSKTAKDKVQGIAKKYGFV